jgi:Na+-translocating ferredoxin:NAD+ oxidoreductase RnfE subunit
MICVSVWCLLLWHGCVVSFEKNLGKRLSVGVMVVVVAVVGLYIHMYVNMYTYTDRGVHIVVCINTCVHIYRHKP